MPLRQSSLPNGPNLLLYRRFTFGNLAEFNVLDTRQYRTDQPCDGLNARCTEALDPGAYDWFRAGAVVTARIGQVQGRWNVIAQQTIMAEYILIQPICRCI